MEVYEQGFKSKEELFDWLRTSCFFKPQFLVRAYPAMDKTAAKNQRGMYDAFSKLCETLLASTPSDGGKDSRPDVNEWRENSLTFFGRKEEYDQIVRKNNLERTYREKFNGRKVMEWTGSYGHVIRDIMGVIRKQFSKEDIAQMDEDALRNMVREVQKNLPVKEDDSKGEWIAL